MNTRREFRSAARGEAQEVASVALLLASDAASYLTGAEVPLDGGLGVT